MSLAERMQLVLTPCHEFACQLTNRNPKTFSNYFKEQNLAHGVVQGRRTLHETKDSW
jgi:hypothetical protein